MSSSTSWLKWPAMIVGLGLVGLLAYQSSIETPPPKIPPKTKVTPPTARGGTVLTSAAALPHIKERDGFVTSKTCQKCHEPQFDTWHDSYHRSMTQVVTPDSVVAPFDDVHLSSRDRDYHLTREGDKFYVRMADPDWEAGAQASGANTAGMRPPIVKREVIMSTGSHHMQGYWVPSSVPNMLRQIPFIYLIGEKRWVPREDIFIAPPDGDRHWAVWNDNCMVCHAVAGNPNFDLRNVKVATEVAELGISCEACHGPGKPHVEFHENKANTKLTKDPVINPAKCDSRISSEICGQCHSYFKPHDMESFATQGYTYRAGGDLKASHNFITFEDAKANHDEIAEGTFWNDGTCRLSGREYTAMIESPCFQRGQLSCVSCHSSHSSEPNDQLAKDMLTNKACLQCHPKYAEDLTAHTHHAADSSGSLCYNCHMPHTSFGLMKGIRSHRVQSPVVASREKRDQPNACNLCHLDQTLAWSADKLHEWYGQPKPELSEDETKIAASILWMQSGNAVQRALAVWHAMWPSAKEVSGKNWQVPFFAQMLSDDYAVVRFLASKALEPQLKAAEQNYDFVGNPEQQRLVRQQILRQWNKAAEPASDDEATRVRYSRLLMDPLTGQLDDRTFKRLLQQQDKRPLYLPE